MQQDDVEVQFCDLCGTSVPMADLESGAAVRHQAKTIGACCLGVLRQGESPLASPGLPAAGGKPARRGGEAGLVAMAIALAVVVFGATIYLDLRVQGVSDELESFRGEVGELMGSDSDVLRTLDQVEAEHIQRVLHHTGGHKGKTSRILDISRPALDRKIKKYGLTVPQNRQRKA